MKTIVPARNNISIGARGNSSMPFDTGTNVTAAATTTIIPPPNAIDVRIVSSFANPLWKYFSKYLERSPLRMAVTPANVKMTLNGHRTTISV